ncbi:MAG: amidase family protein [Pseudomonadota bacterium]
MYSLRKRVDRNENSAFLAPANAQPARAPGLLDFYSHSGPMTRTVSDCLAMFNVSAGQSPRDIASLPGAMRIADTPGDVRGRKIAWSVDLGYFQIDGAVRQNTMRVVDQLRDLGAEMEEIRFPWDESCQEAVQCYLAMLWGQHIKRLIPEYGDLMTDYARETVRDAERFTMEDFLQSLAKAVEVYNVFGAQMEGYDALICPTNAVPAVAADHDSWNKDFRINDVVVDGEYGWVMTHPFNMLSRCPVISVPSGTAENNVPTGVQIVGAAYDETAVFNVAAALEPAFGFQRPSL